MRTAPLVLGGLFAVGWVAGPVWAAAAKRNWQVDVAMTATNGGDLGSVMVQLGERVPVIASMEGAAGRVGLAIIVHPQEDPKCPNVSVNARHTTLTESGETTSKETSVVVSLCADKSIVFDGGGQSLGPAPRMEIALKRI